MAVAVLEPVAVAVTVVVALAVVVAVGFIGFGAIIHILWEVELSPVCSILIFALFFPEGFQIIEYLYKFG